MFNEIKVRIDKHNKNLYKELENIKKNQTELKSISEIKKKKKQKHSSKEQMTQTNRLGNQNTVLEVSQAKWKKK